MTQLKHIIPSVKSGSASLNEVVPSKVATEADLIHLCAPKHTKVFVEQLGSWYTYSGVEWHLSQTINS
jgi:hypothetical protein